MAELVPVQPFDMIVFGATGDLARHKILPALFHRWCDGQVPHSSCVPAAAREAMSTQDFLQRAGEFINGDRGEDRWRAFCERVSYTPVGARGEAPGWGTLKAALGLEAGKARVFYLALPPSIYGPVCAAIAAHGLNTPGSRIVLEKLTGHDFHSARLINEAVGPAFDETAIFRIDHYLGKETVQNLLVLRFSNMLFEPVWNAAGIDHVQIAVAETLGASQRAAYHDRAGALRDMVQNHLLQLVCLVAMEPPASLEGDAVQAEKLKVLRALRLIGLDGTRTGIVRGHYGAGLIGQEPVAGYAEEVGEATRTDTIRAEIDNWRWAGVLEVELDEAAWVAREAVSPPQERQDGFGRELFSGFRHMAACAEEAGLCMAELDGTRPGAGPAPVRA